VIIFRSQDLIDDVAIVLSAVSALLNPVQAPTGKNPLGESHVIDDVVLDVDSVVQVSPGDEVRIDGISSGQKQQYIALNQTRRIICTTESHIEDNIIDHVGFAERFFRSDRLDRIQKG